MCIPTISVLVFGVFFRKSWSFAEEKKKGGNIAG